jgi:hypothetical protein
MEVNIKVLVFWDVTRCSGTDVPMLQRNLLSPSMWQINGDTYFTLKMEAVSWHFCTKLHASAAQKNATWQIKYSHLCARRHSKGHEIPCLLWDLYIHLPLYKNNHKTWNPNYILTSYVSISHPCQRIARRIFLPFSFLLNIYAHSKSQCYTASQSVFSLTHFDNIWRITGNGETHEQAT